MSKRPPAVSVLSANRLRDGIVVYLAADGSWVESIAAAAVARSAAEAQALEAQGARDAANNLVVEPYLAEVADGTGRPVPGRMRERLRVEGPSILDDVPGYVTPNGDRVPSPRQGLAPTLVSAAAPRSSPLPTSGERGPTAEIS